MRSFKNNIACAIYVRPSKTYTVRAPLSAAATIIFSTYFVQGRLLLKAILYEILEKTDFLKANFAAVIRERYLFESGT